MVIIFMILLSYLTAVIIEYLIIYNCFIKHVFKESIWYYKPCYREQNDNDSEKYKITIIDVYKKGFINNWKVRYINNKTNEEDEINVLLFKKIFTNKF